jgi:hypothetical protein
MSQLISARVPDTTAERIRQQARRKQRSLNEMVTIAVEEWLRQNEFAHVEFRDTPDGRLAYMKGSRMSVAWVVKIVRDLGGSVEKAIEHYGGHWQRDWVQAALNYYEAFPEEINAQIADIEGQSYETLKRRLPQLQLLEVRLDPERDGSAPAAPPEA